MNKFFVFLALSIVSTSLWGQFSWNNYKHILIDCESEIVMKTFNGDDQTLSYNAVNTPIRLVFDDYDPEIQKKKVPSCTEITEEQFMYLNKFETAVAFGKIRYNATGAVTFSIYDASSGWNEPVQVFFSGPQTYGWFGHVAESAAKAIASELRVENIRNFDEASSNAYFNSSELTAKQFMDADPFRGGEVEEVKIDYKNVLFQSKDETTDINSIFVISSDSKSCSGVESDGEGLAQLVSLKLMPHFQILERSNLESVLEEQKLSMSGITDESTVLSLGKIQGSEGVVFCQETCVSGQQMQTVKLLDCNTGEQQWIATGFGGNPLVLMDAIIQEIK